jgi:hypothetical protein
MTTEWVITAATERVELSGGNTGETTLTVTNPGPAPDRVVFEVVPGDGADPSWFPPPEEPQRVVAGGASEQFKVKIVVPAGAPAGSYWFQGRAYSADTAPEEGSRLSPRMAFDVKASVKPKKPRWPYAVAAGLVLVVLVVVGILVFGGNDKPKPPNGTAPSSSRPAPTPIVARRPLDIPQTFTVDFDTGTVGGGDDMQFRAQTATIRSLDALGSAQIALLRAGAPATFDACASASLSTTSIPVQNLQPGSVVCVRTSQGRMAVVTVRQPPGPSPGRLVVVYDLFDAR